MARAGQTTVKFNQSYFDRILKDAAVAQMTMAKANEVCARAKSTAPVLTGSYRDSLHVERRDYPHRTGYLVVGDAPHTLLVEAKTGNLARALKASRG
jgi:hypothetical protein